MQIPWKIINCEVCSSLLNCTGFEMDERKEGKKNPTDFRIPVNVAAKLTFNIANIALSFNFVLIGLPLSEFKVVPR